LIAENKRSQNSGVEKESEVQKRVTWLPDRDAAASTAALTLRLSGWAEGPKWSKPFEAATLDRWWSGPAEHTDPV